MLITFAFFICISAMRNLHVVSVFAENFTVGWELPLNVFMTTIVATLKDTCKPLVFSNEVQASVALQQSLFIGVASNGEYNVSFQGCAVGAGDVSCTDFAYLRVRTMAGGMIFCKDISVCIYIKIF